MEEASKKEKPHNSLWRLGEILVQKGWLKWDDLETALLIQKTNSRPLGEILIHRGLITQDVLFEGLAIQFGKKFVRLKDLSIQKLAVASVPKHFAYEYRLMPLVMSQGKLLVAISDPLDVWPISVLGKVTGIQEIETVLSTPQDIQDAITQNYGPEGHTSPHI